MTSKLPWLSLLSFILKLNFIPMDSLTNHHLYPFCVDFGHSLNIWLTVSSVCLHILHLPYLWDFSIWVLIAFVRIACSCAANISDSVSLFIKLSFTHNQLSGSVTFFVEKPDRGSSFLSTCHATSFIASLLHLLA